jgi:RNA polymerase sigma-70 factor, ECF subfamily
LHLAHHPRIIGVGLSDIDRNLLDRCLQQRPRSWEDFVDRFMGLVHHVVNHTAQARSLRIAAADRDDLCAEVFLAILENDFAILRNFRGQCSLATYLTVIARRIVVRILILRQPHPALNTGTNHPQSVPVDPSPTVEQRLSNHEEVARLLGGLQGTEAEVVRMFHLEGKSYHEISHHVGMPENSIGPILSRARNKMRRAGVS